MSEHPGKAISFFLVCLGLRDSLCSTRGRIILVCVRLALSCACWVEAGGPYAPSSDVLCHSSLTCWHLPHRRRLCAALITVTADLQLTKNPRAVLICSASPRWMGDKTHSRHARTDIIGEMQWRMETGLETPTRTHSRLEGARDPNPKLAAVIIPSVGNDWKLLRVTFV